MSEKIGNAITDQKSTVELVTADTVISGGNVIATASSATAGATHYGLLMALIEKEGNLYAVKVLDDDDDNPSTDDFITAKAVKIDLPV